MRTYVSLWDYSYCAKGLTLYRSLIRHSSEPFQIFVLPMDIYTAEVLDGLSLPSLHVLSQDGFEYSMGMRGIRESRKWNEYCWGCASALTEMVNRMTEDTVTYLDSDLWFCADPKVIFDEIGDRSIAIVPHRFPAHRKDKEENGIFNVSLVSFRNTAVGRQCLRQWYEDCKEWCFDRLEDGKFGDQKYLDSWPSDYGDECCVIQNTGVGVAPWNMEDHSALSLKRMVFFHLHEFREMEDGSGFVLTNYDVRDIDEEFIYKPYILEYRKAKEMIASVR